MIRLWITGVSLASLIALYNVPPKPSVSGISVREAAIGADSVQYMIRTVLSKNPRTGDSVKIVFHRDSVNGKPALNVTKWRFFRVDSAPYVVDKVFGKVANYSACANVKNGTFSGLPRCTTWSTNLADTIPPTVDTVTVSSIIVKPDSVKLVIGNKDASGNVIPATQQFCALVGFDDGHVALRAIESNKSPCPTEYAKFSLAERSVTLAEQVAADRVCIDWKATGGTIGAEVCGSSS